MAGSADVWKESLYCMTISMYSLPGRAGKEHQCTSIESGSSHEERRS